MKLFEIFIENNREYEDYDNRTKLIVAENQEEAEKRAEEWMNQVYGKDEYFNPAYEVEQITEVDDHKIIVKPKPKNKEKAMLLFDVYKNEIVINKILVNRGEFRFLSTVRNSLEGLQQIIYIILRERPQKLIVEKMNNSGKELFDCLNEVLPDYDLKLENDGTVIYE